MSDETLLRHFNLLQQEFHKINNKYQSLKLKYDHLLLISGNNDAEDNFLNNFNKIIRSLYKDKKYSDLSIKLQKNIIPGHKIIFEANGGEWNGSDLTNCEVINLENEEQNIGEQIIKWLYLQELNDNQSSDIIWKIMKIAHEHNLKHLKSRCENGLISKVTKDNCIYFYMKASELVVENLRTFCSKLIIANWIDYQSSDFNCLEASIFLDLLELQSNYPLHEAVKANRDDAVFLYINENFSQLEELVNTISDENEIVLDLALTSRRVELCDTLFKNCANPNSVDNYGWSLLHKAILRQDEFSAALLIQNGCHLNPLSPDNLQTPLQLIANLSPCNEDREIVTNISKIATLLIQNGADVNYVDNNNMTALCLAILSGNELVMMSILESGRCNSINGGNSWYTNKSNTRPNSTVPRSSSCINLPPLPLWLAVCREYRPELLKLYKDFKEEASMISSPTFILIENDADPGCLYNYDTGNSIIMELISQNMETAGIFILETYNNKQKMKIGQSSTLLSTESLINMTNNFKESLLHLSVEKEFVNLCKLLLQLGADPNAIRRKPCSPQKSSSKDEIFSSCDSLQSYSSLKDFELINNNEISKTVCNDSSDSVISSWSSKTDDLNPFKEYMKTDTDELRSLSLSLPMIQKVNTNRGLLVDLALNRKQNKEVIKTNHRCKMRKTNSEKQLIIDLCTPTHLAVKTKNHKIINTFINHDDENDCRINWLINDSSGESPFTLTLWNGLISVADKIFKKLIRSDFKTTDIDRILIDGQSLFYLAVLKNNIEAVQFLIKIGCDINVKSSNGITPLQLATDKLNIDIVRILCLSGSDPNITYLHTCNEGYTELISPLWTALINNKFDIADVLVEAGADIDMWSLNSKDNYEETLLHRAIYESKEEAANFLISCDCDTSSPRENRSTKNTVYNREFPTSYIDGNTPLHMACEMGLESTVKNLLSAKNINVDAENDEGCTALHLAIKYRQESVLTHLLNPKYKLNLSIRNHKGHTPFHTAMDLSNQKAAKSILIYHPQAADEIDNLGRNFLHVAVQTMNREAVFFLIQVNANLDVRIKDAFQYTPLHLAIISGAPEDMIRSLILAGACIENETIEKQNLLHLAVLYERTYLIGFLLENGASTSHLDNKMETPLHLAVKGGNKDIIEPLLIKSSTTIKAKNLKGENILHILSNNAKENAVVIFSLIIENYPEFPVDEKDACGNTALFLCALNGHIRLGVSLLMKGSSLGCINNDRITLFNCESISEQVILKLLDSLMNEPNWLDGEVCVSCLCKFSIKNRKHHCRHCGRLVCGKCSVNEIPIIKFNIKKPVRVCEVCFNFLVNGKFQ